MDRPEGMSITEFFEQILAKIPNPENRARATEVLEWVHKTYPQLVARIAWNQPMFTDHGTYIIGFSYAAKHMSVTPEQAGMIRFEDELEKRNISRGSMLFRVPWDEEVPFDLLSQMIEFNIDDKADITSFWR